MTRAIYIGLDADQHRVTFEGSFAGELEDVHTGSELDVMINPPKEPKETPSEET